MRQTTLPTVRLGQSGTRLQVGAKSIGQLSKSVADTATKLKADAATAPYTIIQKFKGAQKDLKQVRNALKSTERDVEDALAILGGANVQPTGPYSKAAADLNHVAEGLAEAGSEIVKAKALSAAEDATERLKAVQDRIARELEDADQRESVAKEKFQSAFTRSLARHRGPLLVSLSDIKALTGWRMPGGEALLPAPDFSPALKSNDPRRQAAVVMTLAKARHRGMEG
jgi:hypothetical protein